MSENLKVQLKFRIFSNFFKSSATFLKVPPEDLKLQRLFQMFSDFFECSATFSNNLLDFGICSDSFKRSAAFLNLQQMF